MQGRRVGPPRAPHAVWDWPCLSHSVFSPPTSPFAELVKGGLRGGTCTPGVQFGRLVLFPLSACLRVGRHPRIQMAAAQGCRPLFCVVWSASKSPDLRVQGGARCIAIEGLGPSLAWHLGGGLTECDSTIPHSPLYIVLWRGRVGDQLAAGHPPVSGWWCGVSCVHTSELYSARSILILVL